MVPNFSSLNKHRWVLKLADYSFTVLWMAAVVFAVAIFVLGLNQLLEFWR